MYVPQNEEEYVQYSNQQQKFNANVIVIGFHILKDKSKLALGDPIFCQNCIAALNVHSKLTQIQDKNQQINIKKSWVCEFCQHNNIISIEDEEFPKEDDLVYMLQSNNQVNQQQSESDIYIIFCIDNSGSMAVTSEIKGDIQLKRKNITKEEIENLKQFMEPWELQQYLKDLTKNQKFVSRKACVLAAIESQLEEQMKQFPKRKVGLIVFNDDVNLIGDASQNSLVITGDKLYNYEQCFQEGQKLNQTHMQIPVSQSYQNLIKTFEQIQEKGKTALGPALVASLGLASQGKPGSMIVMCTDGLANVGIGSMDTDLEQNKSQEFYEKVANYAQEKGIVIQTITMKGEQCNIMNLGKLSERTQGKITRVNPETIQQDFASVMKDEVLATSVQLRILLHSGLQFNKIKELDDQMIIEGQTCTRKVGIVTEQTSVSFEYDLKSLEQLKQANINIKNYKELPFQAHIFYTSQEGHKMVRVITRLQPISNDIKEVRKKAKLSLLNKHVEMNNARRAIKGNVKDAEDNNNDWNDFIQNQQILISEDMIQVQSLNEEEKNLDQDKIQKLQEIQQELVEIQQVHKINFSNNEMIQKQKKIINRKQNNNNNNNNQQQQNKQEAEEEESNAMDLYNMM